MGDKFGKTYGLSIHLDVDSYLIIENACLDGYLHQLHRCKDQVMQISLSQIWINMMIRYWDPERSLES